jgi:peptidylprolyl isomerase
MNKQQQNVWITAAVVGAAALILLALSSLGGTARPAAPQPAAPQPAAQLPAAPQSAAPQAPAGSEVTLPSGLRYVDIVVGTGPQANPAGSVVVHYEGFLENGTKFDSSRDRGQPATFPLNGVIRGFSEGLSTMKVGGKRTLLIPAALGYGPNGSPPTIPPNANLRFEVELVGVQ